MRALFALLLACLLLPLSARADWSAPASGEVLMRDMPGTSRRWLEARAVIDAPIDSVRRWFVEYERWPLRFRDVAAARLIGRAGGVASVWLRSRLLRGEVVLEISDGDSMISFRSRDRRVHALGRVWLTRVDARHTDVIVQSSASLSGFLGAMVPKGLIHDRQRDKIHADLEDLKRLASAERSAAPNAAPTSAPPSASPSPPAAAPAPSGSQGWSATPVSTPSAP